MLDSLANGVMNGKAEVTRREVRNGMKKSIQEVKMLSDKTRSKHKIVCDILKDLESNEAGMLSKKDLKKYLSSMP